MRGSAVLLFVAAAVVVTACESSEEDLEYRASLSGGQEVPPVTTTTATGTFTAEIEDGSNVMTYNLSFTGLGSNASMAHIHGPAAVGANANILVDLNAPLAGRTITLDATAGTATGTINLAVSSVITATVSGDSLRKLFDAGQLYVNVHTANFGNGEIRGQITKQ
jgi:hypothetical protein